MSLFRTIVVAFVTAGVTACAPEPEQVDQPVEAGAPVPTAAQEDKGAIASPQSGSTSPAVTADRVLNAVSDTLPPFSQRVVIFIEASAADLDAARAGRDEESYYVMADDLMFYRATAHEFLEKNGLPVRTLKGRQPLSFVVNGAAKPFDYSHMTTLDVIILYDTNRAPIAVAPIEAEEAARSYYQFD